ncbi:MAG: type II secretion system F family protein [Acidimicrobiia bacterium]|nr:type II secretion system F family protein [Acidimicrobiia bacterium]
MPLFAYAGRTRSGERVQGERTADSIDLAVAALRGEAIVVTRINAVARPPRNILAVWRVRQVAPRTLAQFTRQLSVMIDAGLPLVRALDLLADQETDPRFARVIVAARADVERGLSLADALRGHPDVFDALFTGMVAAGEAGGVLDVILARLAGHVEGAARLQSRVRAAMAYPALVLGMAGVVIVVVLWTVVPAFAGLFAGLGAELPLPTRAVIALGESVVRLSPVALVGTVALLVAWKRWYRSDRGRRFVDGALLRTAVVGPLLRKVAVARFCRTLGTLLASGVAILDALDITARSAGNAVVEAAVRTVRARIERGESLAGPIGETGVFPSMVAQMVGVGEVTGALDTMLVRIADVFEDEVDVAVAGLLTLLEPLMIAVLGVVVGGIVIAMYMPIVGLIAGLAGT